MLFLAPAVLNSFIKSCAQPTSLRSQKFQCSLSCSPNLYVSRIDWTETASPRQRLVFLCRRCFPAKVPRSSVFVMFTREWSIWSPRQPLAYVSLHAFFWGIPSAFPWLKALMTAAVTSVPEHVIELDYHDSVESWDRKGSRHLWSGLRSESC